MSAPDWQLVDLTLPLTVESRGVSYEPHHDLDRDGFRTTDCLLYSHAGTHIDAQIHMMETGSTIDQIDLNRCIGPARVVDVARVHPGLMPEDLILDEPLVPGERVLLRTGWDQHADTPRYREGFPHMSTELAEWLAGRGVVLVGIDVPSVGDLSDRRQLQATHRALLSRDVVIVECLINLGQLATRVDLTVLPLRLVGLDGSPARAVARTPIGSSL